MALRPLLVLILLAAVLAAPARAQHEPVIPPGVTIAGVAVGGLTEEEAEAAVQAAFDRPLAFSFRTRRWYAAPGGFGAFAHVERAVDRALAADRGDALALAVSIDLAKVRAYVGYLDRGFSRPARNSALLLRRLRPFVTKSRSGLAVRRLAMRVAILRALDRTERAPLSLKVRVLQPTVTRRSFGPIVVIRRESKRLYLYQGMRFVAQFGVATGQASYPTPTGRFSIVVKAQNPWWFPPPSDWARGLQPVPPGPGNPLGTRWMGLSARRVGIHGTPDAASIGYSASHGCIRMRIADAEWLFTRVHVGTPVFIVRA